MSWQAPNLARRPFVNLRPLRRTSIALTVVGVALTAWNAASYLRAGSGAAAKSAEVARLVGVSTQTASVIMRSLEKRGLIERCAPVRGKVGQPSVPMQLARDGALFFGLKVGRRTNRGPW